MVSLLNVWTPVFPQWITDNIRNQLIIPRLQVRYRLILVEFSNAAAHHGQENLVFCIQEILVGENRPYVPRPRFLVLEKFITCLPPEKPRDIAFIPSVLKRVQRWRVTWIWSINAIYVKDLKFNVEDCEGYIYSDVPHSTVKQMRKKKNSISYYNHKPHWALALVNGVRGPQRQG